MFEKVSRSLKYDSIFFVHKLTYISRGHQHRSLYPMLHMRGKYCLHDTNMFHNPLLLNLVSPSPRQPNSAASCTPGLKNESFLVYTSAIDG